MVASDQGEWLQRLDPELENILSAIAWCRRAPGGASKEMRIAADLRNYWEPRGLHALGLRVIKAASEREGADAPHAVRRKLLGGIGNLTSRMGQHEESRRAGEILLSESTAAGDRSGVAAGHRMLGTALSMLDQLPLAREHLQQAIAILRELGDKQRLSGTLGAMGELLRTGREYEASAPWYEEALAVGREAGDHDTVAVQLLNLASVAIEFGDPARARGNLGEALGICVQLSSKYIGTMGILTSGVLAMAESDGSTAARFLGAAAASREAMGVTLDPADRDFVKPWLLRTREALPFCR